MTELQAIAAVAPSAADAPASAVSTALAGAAQPTSFSFADVLSHATATLESRVANADDLVRRFVIDDSIPAHEVTIALEQARLAVDLALQVRTRVVEAYREIMNMQL